MDEGPVVSVVDEGAPPFWDSVVEDVCSGNTLMVDDSGASVLVSVSLSGAGVAVCSGRTFTSEGCSVEVV